MSPLISVIVPVYKVEEYLDRCVESIVEQTYQNLEIILVDDGSPDNCPKMCDKWAEKDSRIKVIHKENGGRGPSEARNFGVELSNGEYIAFIDSDDYVLPEYIEYLFHNLIKYDADISCCNLKYVYSTKKERSFTDDENYNNIQSISGLEACYKIYETDYSISLIVPHCKLYKREIVEKNPYPLGRLHEDDAITYKMLYESNTVALGSQKLYGYYQNIISITHSKNQKNIEDIYWGFSNRADFFNENGYRELATATWDKLAKILISNFNISKDRFTTRELAFFCKHLLNRNLSKDTAKKFFFYLISPNIHEKYLFGFKNSFIDYIKKIKYYLLFLPLLFKLLLSKNEKKAFVLATCKNEYNSLHTDAHIFKLSINTYLVCKNILSKLIKKDDLIVIDGGKSSGSYNYYIENIIRDIVSSFPENKIIITPKKIAFDNNDTADKELWLSKTAFSKNKNVIYYCEDEASLDFLNKNFKDINQTILSKETDLREIINQNLTLLK